MKKFIKDAKAVSTTFEYILLIGIMVIYIALFFVLYAGEFEVAPARNAIQSEFEDVGNDVSSKIADTYVAAPASGYLKTRFYIPPEVGKYQYKVEFKEMGLDQQIRVSALYFQKEVMITLNKIGSILGLVGSAYSTSAEHWLSFSSWSPYDITAIAVVYPEEVSYNTTTGLSDAVTFDGSDSKGIGDLQFTWDFDDGTTSHNVTEYHQYSNPGIYNATLTVYDSVQERSATDTVRINVTEEYIEPGIRAYKYVTPRSFRVGAPTTTKLIIYGKGTPQKESNLDVVQATDVSGSMDPDWLRWIGQEPDSGYTPVSNITLNGSAGSKIWTQTFNLASAADETIEKLYVELWNVGGSNNLDMYVKPPGGNIERVQNITSGYERYIKDSPPAGTYTIYVLGDFPVASQQFRVNVNKTSKIGITGVVDMYSWKNTTYNLNTAKWMETNITWPDKDVDLDLQLISPPLAQTYLPSLANQSTRSRNWERIYLTNINAGIWTVAVYNNGTYPPPDFSLSASPFVRTVQQSDSTTYTVTLASINEFAGSISLSISGLPTGGGYSFSTNPVALTASSTGTSTLTVTTASTTPVGNYSLTITGTNGTITHSATVYLNVTPYTIVVNAYCYSEGAWISVPITMDGSATGSNTQSSFSLTGSHTLQVPATDSNGHAFVQWKRPDGSTTASNPITFYRAGTYTAYFGQTPTPTYSVTINAYCSDESKSQNVAITMDGSPTGFTTPHTFSGLTGTHTFTVPNTDPGGHPFWRWQETGQTGTTVTMSGGGTRTAEYYTPIPDFTLSNPGTQTLNQGSSKTATVKATSINGYNKLVSLTVSGVPGGTTITFSPTQGTPTFSSTMNINVGAGTATGDYPVTITATGSDGKVRTQTFTLRVIPPPDFSISASPGSRSISVNGGSLTYDVTLASLNNFAGSISLSVSGLPSGVTSSFSSNPVSLTAGQTKTSTLTVFVPHGTAIGTYILTITGKSGSTTHSTSVTLNIVPPPPAWLYWLTRLLESASPMIRAQCAPTTESFTGYIRLGETTVTSFNDTLIASEPPRWDNTENPFQINESIENYKISMNYLDQYGNRTLHLWVSKNGGTPVLVAGLKGDYYDNTDFTNLKLTRLDPVVNFNWGGGSPDSSIGADTFSVRWNGYVKADRSETYTFTVYTDDGSRVWIDDNLIIDYWFDQAEWRSGSIALTAGWHKIRYDYYENGGGAAAQLYYSSPSTPQQIIPQDHLSPFNMISKEVANLWTKYDNTIPPASDTTSTNGRIPLGTSGRGDSAQVLQPFVIKDGSTYKMWFRGMDGNNTRIYHATSPDGLTWTKYDNTVPPNSDTSSTNGRIPLGTAGKGDSKNLWKMCVIKDGSTYKMWYTATDGTTANHIYYATSPDGLTWTKYDNTLPPDSDTTSTNGRIPIGTAGKGDSNGAQAPFVIKDGSTYKMWYTGAYNSKQRIYYATSPDGLTWTKYDNSVPADSDTSSTNGRVPPGTAGKGDSNGAMAASVIKENSTYKMWYGGYDGTTYRVYYATSPDGLTWTKYDSSIPADSDTTSTNNRIPLGTYGKGDDSQAYYQNVIKDNSTYRMWYSGNEGTNSWRIYHATQDANQTGPILYSVTINYEEVNVSAPANYTVYVTGTFLDGTQAFNLQTYMAKLDAARISGRLFEDLMGMSDKSGLVSFGGNTSIMNVSDVRVVTNLTSNHSQVKAGFNTLIAHNATPTGEAIDVATQLLVNFSEYFTANNRTRIPVIILLSDGLPTLPATLDEIAQKNYTRAVQYAIDQAKIAKSKGILIYTIGYGVDANMSVMADISSGEGYYFFAATKEELQSIYKQIAAELREFAGRNAVVTDVVRAGIEVKSVSGAFNKIKNADGTTTIVWNIGDVKIHKPGSLPVSLAINITTLNFGEREGNVMDLSNVTYNSVVTGNQTTFAFPQTKMYASVPGGNMILE